MITIVDYGMGNLRSVQKAFEWVGAAARITDSPAAVRRAGRLVLPGVGAFGDAAQELRRRRLWDPVMARLRAGVPFLGVCLGLQLLCERSEESPGVRGFGFLEGRVLRLPRRPASLKIPHMGWNQLQRGVAAARCPVLRGVPDGAYVYFVHSYYAAPADRRVIAATTTYGCAFPAVVWQDNLVATQFHPEKSQRAGLTMLKNFVEWSC